MISLKECSMFSEPLEEISALRARLGRDRFTYDEWCPVLADVLPEGAFFIYTMPRDQFLSWESGEEGTRTPTDWTRFGMRKGCWVVIGTPLTQCLLYDNAEMEVVVKGSWDEVVRIADELHVPGDESKHIKRDSEGNITNPEVLFQSEPSQDDLPSFLKVVS